MSVGCGGGWAGYPSSVSTAARAASATAMGSNSTVVSGGELSAAIGVGVDAHHGEVVRAAQARLPDSVQDQARDLVALRAHRGDAVAHPIGDHLRGVLHGDLGNAHGRKIASLRRAGDPCSQ